MIEAKPAARNQARIASDKSLPPSWGKARMGVSRASNSRFRNMNKMPGSGWTRDKEILTLDLYFRHGRQRLSANHPEVTSLACAIDKKPSAVNYRMGNVVACDPDNPSKGFVKVTKQTKNLWDEFAHDEPRLLRTASAIRRKYGLDEDG